MYGIDLTIDNGAFVAFLDPSRCGKSTTLFMLSWVYQPTGGEIRFDGARRNAVEARNRNVGIRPEMLRAGETGLSVTTTRFEAIGRETLSGVDSPLAVRRFLEATARPGKKCRYRRA